MPAMRFFAMYEAANKIDAREKLELADLHYIPAATFKWYEYIRNRYEQRLSPIEIAEIKRQSKQGRPVLEADSEQAKNVLFTLFAQKKGLR